MTTMLHRLRARLAPRDESGFTIVMVLLTIIIISTVFAAVLTLEDTTLRSQEVLANKRKVDLAADAAIDLAIGQIRTDAAAGVYDPYNGNNPCPVVPSLDYSDPQGAGSMHVVCTPQAGSGGPVGTQGYPAKAVITILGGVAGKGNRKNGANPNDIPFCDDWNTTGGACEAGLFVGGGVNTDGGLIVGGNGGQQAGAPVVISNGSIIAKDGTTDRALNIQSPFTISARRACVDVNVGYVDDNTPGAPPPTSGSASTWQCKGGTTTPANDTAEDGYLAQTGQSNANSQFEADPAWRHELWDTVTAARDGTNLIGTQTSTTKVAETPPVKPVTSWDQADPSRPTNDATVTNVCADHFVDFLPGTYNDLQALDNLMQSCPAYTTYWFEPGSYYFDFVDVGTATYKYWREPVNYSQIVAGSIPPAGSGHEWKPCGNCAQPTHTMTPNKIDPSGWGQDLNADGDYSDPGEDGSPDKGNLIDNKWAYVTMDRSGSTNGNISQRTSHTPLLPTATVQNVKFAIHETHDAINSVSCTTGQPPGTCNPWDGPNGNVKVRLQVAGLSGAWCEFQVGLSNSTISTVESSTGDEVFDITNGCPTGTGYFATGGGFPTSWTADNVNKLKATYYVQRASWSGSFKPTPNAALDGEEFRVAYTGPPAPDFPNGCDPAANGVQWIFGNLSRMQFIDNDVYIELCGSEGTKDHHGIAMYGLAWGDTPPPLEELSSGHQFIVAADGTVIDAGQTVTTPSTGQGGMKWFTDALLAPLNKDYTQKTAVTGVDPWEIIGDSSNAYTTASWGVGSTGTALLYYTLPNNWIPTGSVIEHVQLKVRHAEPLGAGYNIKLKVQAGSSAADPGDVVAGGGSVPQINIPALQSCSPPQPVGTPWVSGDARAGTYNLTSACDWSYGATHAEAAHLGSYLSTAGSLNGAELQLSASANSGAKLMMVDGIEVSVWYRPPGMLRPVRGCMTLATGYAPASDPFGLANPSGSLNSNFTSSQVFSGTADVWNGDYNPTYNGWMTSNDQGYGTGTGNADHSDCGLFVFRSQSSAQGAKLHVNGDIYAPTAAIDLSGKDNDASFVTDGVVARHLTALRWKLGPGIPAFGCVPAPCMTRHDPRDVVIDVFNGTTKVASAHVIFDDGDGSSTQIGQKVTIVSWHRFT